MQPLHLYNTLYQVALLQRDLLAIMPNLACITLNYSVLHDVIHKMLSEILRNQTAWRIYLIRTFKPFMSTSLISTHTSHARRDLHRIKYRFRHFRFLLTRLMRGVTEHLKSVHISVCISTHTPHARRDLFNKVYYFRDGLFLLTRLMRGVTCFGNQQLCKPKFLLTRLMRGVTLCQ